MFCTTMLLGHTTTNKFKMLIGLSKRVMKWRILQLKLSFQIYGISKVLISINYQLEKDCSTSFSKEKNKFMPLEIENTTFSINKSLRELGFIIDELDTHYCLILD